MVKKGRKKMQGKGVKESVMKGLKAVNKFLKDTKAISTVAGQAARMGYSPQISGPIANIASLTGYGKKRRIRFK